MIFCLLGPLVYVGPGIQQIVAANQNHRYIQVLLDTKWILGPTARWAQVGKGGARWYFVADLTWGFHGDVIFWDAMG